MEFTSYLYDNFTYIICTNTNLDNIHYINVSLLCKQRLPELVTYDEWAALESNASLVSKCKLQMGNIDIVLDIQTCDILECNGTYLHVDLAAVFSNWISPFTSVCVLRVFRDHFSASHRHTYVVHYRKLNQQNEHAFTSRGNKKKNRIHIRDILEDVESIPAPKSLLKYDITRVQSIRIPIANDTPRLADASISSVDEHRPEKNMASADVASKFPVLNSLL